MTHVSIHFFDLPGAFVARSEVSFVILQAAMCFEAEGEVGTGSGEEFECWLVLQRSFQNCKTNPRVAKSVSSVSFPFFWISRELLNFVSDGFS